VTPSKLYKWSLALPVLVPVALLPLARSWRTAPGPVEWVLQVLVLSFVYGGVPYLVLVCALVWWMRGKGEREIRLALRLAPLLMLPIFWGCLWGYLLWTSWPEARASDFWGTLELSGYVIVLGYAYVLVVTLLVAPVTGTGRGRRRSRRAAA
jgi:hypothetical protein